MLGSRKTSRDGQANNNKNMQGSNICYYAVDVIKIIFLQFTDSLEGNLILIEQKEKEKKRPGIGTIKKGLK